MRVRRNYLVNKRQVAAASNASAKPNSSPHCTHLTSWRKAKKPNEIKPAHVSLSDPDAGFMCHGDGAITPSYNVQFTTDTARGLVVGIAVSKASNDAQQLALAMDRLRQQNGFFPAQ